jgi:ParB family chromosome partitioning protein
VSRRGLGRGLDALLPSVRTGETPEAESRLRDVRVEEIAPNPLQPRRNFDDETIEELAASIRTLGVLQPLLARERGEGYELVAGERRLRAAKRAGLERVPVLLVDTDEQGSLERALVENIHREDLNPIEEATAYRALIDATGSTHELLAEKLGRHRVTVSNSLRLLDLPTEMQQLMVQRKLSGAHGRVLLTLQGNPFQRRLAQRIANEGLTVREAEEIARRYEKVSADTRGATRETVRPELTEAQRTIAGHLQTRVRVEMGKRRGKVVLDFASLEELDRIVRVITGDSRGATERSVSPE